MTERSIFDLSDEAVKAFVESPALDAVPDAVIVIDDRGEVIAFNAGAHRLFGYSREQAVGRPVAELIIPPHLREAHWIAFERFRAGGDPHLIGRRAEFEAVREDGSTLIVELGLAQLRRDPLVVAGFLQDISERRSAQARGLEMSALFEQAERMARLGSWSWDPETDEVVWSDELFRIHGYEPGAVEPSLELALRHMTPEDRAVTESHMDAYRRDRSAGALLERRMIRADGEERIVVTRSQVADQPGGRVIGIIQDVTEARETERELKRYLRAGESLREWRLAEGTQGLLSRLAEPLEWLYGAIWLPEPGDRALRCDDTWSAADHEFDAFDAASRRLRFPPGRGLVGRAWQGFEPIGIQDLAADTEFLRAEAAQQSGLGAGLAFPAVREGRIVGVFEFYGPRTRRLSAELARALSSIGYQLGFLLDRRAIAAAPGGPLSAREREILALAASGSSTPKIAEQLVLSPETVKTHFERIYAKLEVRDRAAAVAQGFRRGLLT